MRIAMTIDPLIPLPCIHYGGIERIVGSLIDNLVSRGHQLTLFGHRGSRVPCELIPLSENKQFSLSGITQNMMIIARRVVRERYDVVHCHSRLAHLLPLLPLDQPKVMTYHRLISKRSVLLGAAFSYGKIHYTAVGSHMTTAVKKHGIWHVIHNGIPLETYHFRPEIPPDAPLVFLGRIEPMKGTDAAIEAAQAAGRKLVIAAILHPEHREYYESKIKPFIDGKSVRYIGPVDDAQKSDLLGSAAALLMPIRLEEPFGLVMAEALACGTPVIAFRRGAVPEIVENGVNGFICNDTREMAQAIGRVAEISRTRCRESAENKFSASIMTDRYEALYRSISKPEKKK